MYCKVALACLYTVFAVVVFPKWPQILSISRNVLTIIKAHCVKSTFTSTYHSLGLFLLLILWEELDFLPSLRWCWFSTEFSSLLVMLLICGEMGKFSLVGGHFSHSCSATPTIMTYAHYVHVTDVILQGYERFQYSLIILLTHFFLYVCALLLCHWK